MWPVIILCLQGHSADAVGHSLGLDQASTPPTAHLVRLRREIHPHRSIVLATRAPNETTPNYFSFSNHQPKVGTVRLRTVYMICTCPLRGHRSGSGVNLNFLMSSALPQRELNERLAAILAISQRLNSQRDLSALLDLIAREATSLLECDRASIFILDRENNELWSKVALGSDEILRFDSSRGIAGCTATTGETINVNDAYSDSRFYTGIDDRTGYRTRNLLAVAVRNQHGKIIGAFEALNKRAGEFTARDEESLTTLASHAATAIETAQLIGELRRNQDELAQQNAHLWREVESRYATHGIIGSGQRIQQVVRLIERIRDSVVNVLITGESGTGKELAAKAVHYNSPAGPQPFVALNCAALPETLLERSSSASRGSGDRRQFARRPFQKADGGTLFLDEIGDLSLTAKPNSARSPGTRAKGVGGRTSILSMCAGGNQQRSGGREIVKGTFREDLYYRIKVIHIHMPPLREIRDEIPLLARHFLRVLPGNKPGADGVRARSRSQTDCFPWPETFASYAMR